MGLFDKMFGKKGAEHRSATDTEIVALANGEVIDITTVKDQVFASKAMGEGVAFKFTGDKVTICSPVNGTMTVIFPTGHAFGVTMDNGVEILVHIGIDTVETNGSGFKILKKKQGDRVKAGDEIVEVDLKTLGQKYDMSTMLIVTNPNGKNVVFKPYGNVAYMDTVAEING